MVRRGYRVTIDGRVFEGHGYRKMPDAVFAALLKDYNDFNAEHPFEQNPETGEWWHRNQPPDVHPANDGPWLIGVEQVKVKGSKMRRVR